MGRRGQGQAGGRARRARRLGRALPGRGERRPHGAHRGPLDGAAPDPERHPAFGRALRDRERRGARPRDAVHGGGRARARRGGRGGAPVRQRPGAPGAGLSQAGGQGERGEQGHRHHRPRASVPRTRTRSRAVACASWTCGTPAGCARWWSAAPSTRTSCWPASAPPSAPKWSIPWACSSRWRRGCWRSRTTSGSPCTGRSAAAPPCCSRARRARCSTWITAPIPS